MTGKDKSDNTPDFFMRERISFSMMIILIIFILVGGAFFIYQQAMMHTWKDKYTEVQQELEKVRQSRDQYKQEYENLREDVQKYDRIYSEQRSELEYSKDIAILELSLENRHTDCLKTIDVGPSGSNLVVNAQGVYAGGWPVLHVFLDGTYVDSFKVDSESGADYTSDLELAGSSEHEIDIMFSNDHYEESSDIYRQVNIKSISISGTQIAKSNTYFDEGNGPDAFNCEGSYSKWEMSTNGAVRFNVERRNQ